MTTKKSNETKIIAYKDVESRVIEFHWHKIFLDSGIAQLYQVETKRINEAVKNNPDKFSENYIIEISKDEKKELVEILKHLATSSKAFAEQDLCMLAAILKSPVGTQTKRLDE